MSEQELLADCLRRLNRAGIKYYLTGSMAGNYWGAFQAGLRRRSCGHRTRWLVGRFIYESIQHL